MSEPLDHVPCYCTECRSDIGQRAGSAHAELDAARAEAVRQVTAELEALRELYRERAHLVAYLTTRHPSVLCTNDPGYPDWPLVYVSTARGQMSWHISQSDLDLFDHVPRVPVGDPDAPTWDGHTTEDKYARLRELTGYIAHKRLSFERLAPATFPPAEQHAGEES